MNPLGRPLTRQERSQIRRAQSMGANTHGMGGLIKTCHKPQPITLRRIQPPQGAAMTKKAAKPKKEKIKPPVPRAAYDAVVSILVQATVMLGDMEKAGALRLPFPGYEETVKLMRGQVKR